MSKENKEVAAVSPAQMTSVEGLLSQAIAKGATVDTLERLLTMRRELQSEFAKKQYDTAMAAFQVECPVIKKTKEVKLKSGTTAYKYAPIESILKQVKALLQRHGFSYTTRMELMANGVKAIVKVTHTDGHSEESAMEVPFGTKTDVMSQSQVAAAAQTFAKRYAFCNAFGILTGDEDSEEAVGGALTPPDRSSFDEAAGKLRAAKNKADLGKAWRGLTERQRRDDEVRAVAKECKRALEK